MVGMQLQADWGMKQLRTATTMCQRDWAASQPQQCSRFALKHPFVQAQPSVCCQGLAKVRMLLSAPKAILQTQPSVPNTARLRMCYYIDVTLLFMPHGFQHWEQYQVLK
jgi:hypothetical protein